jgi:hypothetical protein
MENVREKIKRLFAKHEENRLRLIKENNSYFASELKSANFSIMHEIKELCENNKIDIMEFFK